MQTLILTCTILSIIISCFALVLGAYSAIIVVGLRNSTHRIEWKPIEDPFKNNEEDVEEFEHDPTRDI